jgi:hypothetical protein
MDFDVSGNQSASDLKSSADGESTAQNIPVSDNSLASPSKIAHRRLPNHSTKTSSGVRSSDVGRLERCTEASTNATSTLPHASAQLELMKPESTFRHLPRPRHRHQGSAAEQGLRRVSRFYHLGTFCLQMLMRAES